MGNEEIAARFFVTPAVVRQRLKLTIGVAEASRLTPRKR